MPTPPPPTTTLPPPLVRPPPAIEGVLQAVGRTPLVRLPILESAAGAQVLAKLEFLGPGNSIFDRPAAAIVSTVERSGHLRTGARVFAAGGGDAVISLACACSARGMPLTVVVPKQLHVERKKALVDYGAKVVPFDDAALPPSESFQAAQDKAFTLATESRGVYVNLWEGREVVASYEAIGKELREALGAAPSLTFVGLDLGAAPTGIARGLSGGELVAVEPSRAPVGSGGAFGPHLLGGLVPGPKLSALEPAVVRHFEVVSDEEAWAMAKRVSREAGLLVGIASGAVLVAAERRAARLSRDATVVAVLPDSGERRFMLEPYFDVIQAAP